MRYLVLTLALLLAPIAQAEVSPQVLQLPGVCGPRAELVGELKEKYGEATVLIGMVGTVAVMEAYVNPVASTWSVVMTAMSSGVACILASGEGVEFIEPSKPENPKQTKEELEV